MSSLTGRPVYLHGRRVCEVVGDTLIRRAKPGEQLRKPPAWSFHVSVLDSAERLGAVSVIVRDVASGLTYRATIADIWQHGFVLDRGWGRQMALALERWQVDGAAPAAEQAPLWSEHDGD